MGSSGFGKSLTKASIAYRTGMVGIEGFRKILLDAGWDSDLVDIAVDILTINERTPQS